MTSLRFHTTGRDSWKASRPSDHAAGCRHHWHGPIVPMEGPSLTQRIIARLRQKG